MNFNFIRYFFIIEKSRNPAVIKHHQIKLYLCEIKLNNYHFGTVLHYHAIVRWSCIAPNSKNGLVRKGVVKWLWWVVYLHKTVHGFMSLCHFPWTILLLCHFQWTIPYWQTNLYHGESCYTSLIKGCCTRKATI